MRALPKHSRSGISRPAGRGPRRQQWRVRVVDVLSEARDAVVACIIGMLLLSVAPVLVGWKTTVVVSGSMAPAIRPGDVIAAGPAPDNVRSAVRPGRVVLVDDPVRPGELLLHRLVRYDEQGRMILKGDANVAVDSTPVSVESLRGLPRLRVPAVGLPFLWVRHGRFLPAIAAGFLLLLLVAWQPPPPRQRWVVGPHPRDRPLAEPAENVDPSATGAVLSRPLDAVSDRFSRRVSAA